MQREYFRNLENIASLARIRHIASSDTEFLKQASEIYDESLGQEYIPLEDLVRYARHKDRYVLLGSYVDNSLLGVTFAFPLDEEHAEEFNNAFTQHGINIKLPLYSVGVIKSVAVRPEYRRHGIGTKLTIEAMKRLKDMSCSLFIAPSWDSSLPDSSPKMFERLGFQNVLRIKNYWYEDSMEKGYSCPQCKEPPCRCSVIFYLRKVD